LKFLDIQFIADGDFIDEDWTKIENQKQGYFCYYYYMSFLYA